MINHNRLAEIISAYKEYFPSHWRGEQYKWEAIQHFQKHWDIKAENFADMFMKATDKTYNLLASMNNYPRRMIKAFAEAEAEAVRGMFMRLYDDSGGLAERIEQFRASAEELRMKYDDGTWRQHYQGENAITTWLWLRYPDRYYIYKYSEVRAFAEAVESDFIPKRGGGTANVEGAFRLYHEIRQVIKQDSELNRLLEEALEESCYPDPERITVMVDMGFFVNHFYGRKEEKTRHVWFPADYSPGLSVQEWKELLQDPEVFTGSSLQIMKRFLDYGGEATCTQLSEKYGETGNFYNSGSSALGRRISDKTACPLFEKENGNIKYWTILYVGHGADKETEGSYVWKLRDELKTALEETDLSKVALFAQSVQNNGKEIDPSGFRSNARFKKWMNPVIVALRELGGSADIQEVHDKIIELYEITEEELARRNQSGISTTINDIDWARNYLNYEGFLDSRAPRGIWTLSPPGRKIVISDQLAGMIITKWSKIMLARRENRPVPKISLNPSSWDTDSMKTDSD